MKIWALSLCLFLAVTLMFPSPVMAKGAAFEDTVEEGEVVDHNMVLSGPVVVMDGKIEGDLWAIGDKVTINGEVDGNLVAIGNKVVLNGSVSGSVYVGAATLVFGPQASVGRDVSFVGGMLETQETTSISRDLNLLSLDAEMTGTAGREVNALVGPMRVVILVYEFFQNQGWLPQTQNLDLQFSRAGSVRHGALGMGFGLSSVQSLTRISSAPASEPGLQPPEQQSTITAEQWQEWGVALLRN
ncbi:MAG TPA: polymer-forming cytoskeletal protein, partial [Anaerolineales bacterium]|nr:polymer-forming cytoskeletal protein [Anaerolineales bacterium]